MISIVSEDRKLTFNKTNLKRFVKELVETENAKAGDISIVLCSDEYLLEVNKSYLDHDYFTDIITFDYTEGKRISGDLMISVDRVRDNAKQNGIDEMHEFHRVVFHGVLHLCGYKDKSAKDQAVMRSKEDFYLQKFYEAN
ncbi:MAG: ybeY [Crocinitomicaceae bacterium]|jgi:rRNA maturation RNase YbeY|nr:ybeY [Crocinitomicaceae bacterium]